MLVSIILDHIGVNRWRTCRRNGISTPKHCKPPWVAKLLNRMNTLHREFQDGVRDEANADDGGNIVPVYFHLLPGVYECCSFGNRKFLHVIDGKGKFILRNKVKALLGIDPKPPIRMKGKKNPATDAQNAAIAAICEALEIHESAALKIVYGKYKIGGWRLTKEMASYVIDALQMRYGRIEIVEAQEAVGN